MTTNDDETVKRKDSLYYVVQTLWNRFGRCPTEQEVLVYVKGDYRTRQDLWDGILTDAMIEDKLKKLG